MAPELIGYGVLEIAQNLERGAARFYRKAADFCDDPRVSRLFHELAQWEACHARVFAEMKDYLAEKAWELGYFRAERLEGCDLPAPAVFGLHEDPARLLTGRESQADVLRLALCNEKRTIAYYGRLREGTLGDGDLETLRDILLEEHRHVRILTQASI